VYVCTVLYNNVQFADGLALVAQILKFEIEALAGVPISETKNLKTLS